MCSCRRDCSIQLLSQPASTTCEEGHVVLKWHHLMTCLALIGLPPLGFPLHLAPSLRSTPYLGSTGSLGGGGVGNLAVYKWQSGNSLRGKNSLLIISSELLLSNKQAGLLWVGVCIGTLPCLPFTRASGHTLTCLPPCPLMGDGDPGSRRKIAHSVLSTCNDTVCISPRQSLLSSGCAFSCEEPIF